MRFATTKYAALARKYDLAPEDAAVAAFEAMRTRAVRTAVDPWGVVTRAVQITLIYEARAQGLRSEEHTSELQSLMRSSYAVFCLKKNTHIPNMHKQRHKIHSNHSKKRH